MILALSYLTFKRPNEISNIQITLYADINEISNVGTIQVGILLRCTYWVYMYFSKF